MSQGEKTEQPTEHKLRQARLEGNIARSSDTTANATLLGWCGVFSTLGAFLFDALLAMMRYVFDMDLSQPIPVLQAQYLPFLGTVLLTTLAAPVAAGLVISALPDLAQSRMQLASKRKFISFASLNPVAGFKRIFGLRQLGVLVLTLMRFTVMCALAWWSTRQMLSTVEAMWRAPLLDQVAFLAGYVIKIAAIIGLAIIPFSLIDLLWQRFIWRRGLRMSMQEIRREHKDQEGDPQMKGRRRQIHRQATR
jgi:flagellar biosynthesis protein FlhB